MKIENSVCTEVFLQPGEFYFGSGYTRVRTLLGSCISITLWHPRRQTGGMCHYMLPGGRMKVREGRPLDGRYADEAILMFLSEIRRLGAQPSEFEVKIFGGGRMFGSQPGLESIQVPHRNVKAGEELLEDHGFLVKAQHLGGVGYRQIVFEIWSGDVWVKHEETTAEKWAANQS